MHSILFRPLLACALAVAIGSTPLIAQANLLTVEGSPLLEANVAIEHGDFDSAYAILAPLEPQLAGLEAFDYALARAAMGLNRQDEAISILQRLVTSRPTNAAAWMDLAMLHANRGEPAELYECLKTLEKLNPPPRARAQIKRWLVELGLAQAPTRSLDLVLSGGKDGNANQGTGLDVFEGFTVDDASKALSSAFSEARLQGRITQLRDDFVGQSFYASLSGRQFDADELTDRTSAVISWQKSWNRVQQAWNLGLSGGYFHSRADRQNSAPLTARSINVNLSRNWIVAPRRSWRVGFAAGLLDFSQVAETRSRARYALEVAQQNAPFDSPWILQAQVETYFESPQRSDSFYESRGITTNLNAAYRFNSSVSLGLLGSFDYRDFSETFGLGSANRLDKTLIGSLGLQWQPAMLWAPAVQLEVTTQRRDSNLDLFDFNRQVFLLATRWKLL